MAEPHPLLADRYRLVRQVGSGGMGVVWEAWDERLERPVAVKQLKPQLGLTPEEAELAKNRAMREARITARLHHRNAVPVFDVVEHAGQPCLIMQFLPSVPLSAVLRESGPLGIQEAARVGAQVASALAAAHGLDIVHRDVKPGNILIADDGTALISDFGISHALGDATLTSTGLVHGTPAYLAPEVARGADSGFASDVFSLGATLYAALEGAPPFGTDANSIALLYKVASGDFAPPQRAGALTPVLMQMLRSDPDGRPAMKEAAARFAAVEAGGADEPATLLLPEGESGSEASGETPTAVRVRRDVGPPTFAAAQPLAAAAHPPAASASSGPPEAAPAPAGGLGAVPPAPPSRTPSRSDQPAPRRRRGAWVAAVALLVGLVVLGTALVADQLGRGGGTAAGPASARSTTAAPTSSSASASESESPSGDPTSEEPSDPTSPTDSASSSSTTSTPSSEEPTAAQLEDAITGYYALVPGNTDKAWPLLTKDYQRKRAGGRQGYDGFWKLIDEVSVSDVDADPPKRVEATVTYRRTDGSVSVERTRFDMVRDDGVLKIDDSSVRSS